MIVGGGLFLLASQQQKSEKEITQTYSQIVFPPNFIRVNEKSSTSSSGLQKTPVHTYTYRARGVQPEVVQQVATIFTNAGYRVTTSNNQVEGTDKNLKLTSVIGNTGSTATEQVVTVTAEQS